MIQLGVNFMLVKIGIAIGNERTKILYISANQGFLTA